MTVNSTGEPSLAEASVILSVGRSGFSLTSLDGVPSRLPRVAITRTVYSVPSVSEGMVWVVVDPEEITACRPVESASLKDSLPRFPLHLVNRRRR